LFSPATTRYTHGDPPHRLGFHLQRIMRWVSYGEQHGVRKLVEQTGMSGGASTASCDVPWPCYNTPTCMELRAQHDPCMRRPCAMVGPCYAGASDPRVAALNLITRPPPTRPAHFPPLAFANAARGAPSWSKAGMRFDYPEAAAALPPAHLQPGRPLVFRSMLDSIAEGAPVSLLRAGAAARVHAAAGARLGRGRAVA
jgi:hypothetical protein